ncbi:MAG: YdcF family protein [Myxococcales bacterium]|nr:YdcF family protein [Myxococcales bacterium]
MRRWKRWTAWALGGLLAAPLAFLGTSTFVGRRYQERIATAEEAPSAPVALVFGAGLGPNGALSPVLAERMDAAISLYRAGKVEKLLLSGDNSDRYHDETGAMRRYALGRGVDGSAVVEDLAGLSTYESCYRARAVFGVERAILVTQSFHLPRALFIANSVGIDAHGVSADQGRSGGHSYELREFVSRPLALWMVLWSP